MKGLYIHIPFCVSKCEYCDFYSLEYNKSIVSEYVECMCERLKKINTIFDTVYFGGGTPSIIGANNIIKILEFAKYKENAEITVECNPKSYKKDFFEKLGNSDVNRISIGLQSSSENELKFLTRKHSLNDVTKTVLNARKNKINNISLDVMVGLQNQTIESLQETLDYCINMKVNHISSYMLKIEDGTPFSKYEKSIFPNDDIVADMYLFMCDYLEKFGYHQYEISNFSMKGYESKHNLIYWNCDDYFGLGPSAHSLIDKKRYHFDRNINDFINGCGMICDGIGADEKEYVMLRLRLNDGVKFSELNKRNIILSEKFLNKCRFLKEYIIIDDSGIRLNQKGFLVQNSILVELLEEM